MQPRTSGIDSWQAKSTGEVQEHQTGLSWKRHGRGEPQVCSSLSMDLPWPLCIHALLQPRVSCACRDWKHFSTGAHSCITAEWIRWASSLGQQVWTTQDCGQHHQPHRYHSPGFTHHKSHRRDQHKATQLKLHFKLSTASPMLHLLYQDDRNTVSSRTQALILRGCPASTFLLAWYWVLLSLPPYYHLHHRRSASDGQYLAVPVSYHFSQMSMRWLQMVHVRP